MATLTDEMQRVVQAQRLGFVATVCPDGTPNLSPKGSTAVWDDGHLVFADLASPGTMANLRVNPAIEVNVVDPVLRTGFRFKGRAEVHLGGPIFEQVVSLFERERRIERHRIRGVALMTVDGAAPLVSPAYDTGIGARQIAERSFRRLEEVYGVRILR